MTLQLLTGPLFKQMVQHGATNLSNHRERINKLNVFPVPDGDTGTNMDLSLTSGLNELKATNEDTLSVLLSAFVKGLLMGARGNSGVILSQLFRGFSQHLQEETEVTSEAFAKALENGVHVAYESVTNPVEGTILTVAKDAAKEALHSAQKEANLAIVMEKTLQAAKRSLANTPELLPILKEVGVVDSGGEGLVVIYEGFLAALKGEALPEHFDDVAIETMVQVEHDRAVQALIDAESIEYGYCTEFLVLLDESEVERSFMEKDFRTHLSSYGDSLLVATDENLVKVHIHTEQPGEVMTYAQQFGQLHQIDIDNMRKQHEHIVKEDSHSDEILTGTNERYGLIAVAAGDGLKSTFTSLGVTHIIEGGQTMNPSTEDILRAIESIRAEHVFILPNNKNIILASEQAKQLTEKSVTIIPSKSIPQGISALFAFDKEVVETENETNMKEALSDVKTGLITYATRDTVVNKLQIKADSYIGLDDETIVATEDKKISAATALLQALIDEDDELVTIFFGDDVSDEEVNELHSFIDDELPHVEVEFVQGGQPVYSFVIMVE